MANGDADQIIKVVLSVEDAEALRHAEEFRNEMDRVKLSMQTLAVEGKQSLEDIAVGMIKVRELAKAVADPSEGGLGLSDAQKERNKALDDEIKLIRKVLTEAKKERAEFEKAGVRDAKASASIRKQQAKEVSAVEKGAIKSSQAVQAEYTKITRQGYGVMSAAAKEYGQGINRIRRIIQETAQRTGKTWTEVGQRMAGLGVPIKDINIALGELNQKTKEVQGGFQGLTSKLGNLGSIGKFVFGSVLGIGAVQALQRVTRAFVDFAKEILQRGTEMTEVIFTFEVAIRGLQRIGLDTTISGWTEAIQALKKEFPFFPKREFTEAASLAALMTREFGFTEKQIANIVRQSAILAQITGKDLIESVRGITFAIGSGYFESLQRAGINISRAVVKNEALAQGYEGVYNELEPAIRASVTYSVIQNNLNAIQDDASRKIETFAGQVQILTSRWEDLKNLFGEVVTSSDTLIGSLETLNELLKSIQDVYEAFSGLNIDIFAGLKGFLGLNRVIENVELLTDAFESLADAIEQVIVYVGLLRTVVGALSSLLGYFGFESLSKSLKDFDDTLFNVERSLGDFVRDADELSKIDFGGFEFSKEEWQEILDFTQEFNDKLDEIEEDRLKRRDDIKEDFRRDEERNADKHYDKLEDLALDHQRRLDDIDLKAEQKRADELVNYGNRVADAIRQAAFRREDAERKYREREIKEERRFQEKLRQLRENFLLDLEDAVRERDARQIIRLTRQYNLRRTQMVREEKLGKTDREEAFKEELRQIERQKEERLRQLAVEHQRRLDAITLQAQREKDRERIEFQRRRDAEIERWDQQRMDRIARRDEQLVDLDKSIQDRIDAVVAGLIKEGEFTDDQLSVISTFYENAYGPGGRIDRAILNYQKRLLETEALLRRFALYSGIPLGDPLRFRYETGEQPEYAGPQAEGGTIIARKPTVAIFGEAGPEAATFTPLSQLGAKSTFGGQSISGRQSSTNKLRLEMLLSPDLEARIIDQALDEVADVTFTIERERA